MTAEFKIIEVLSTKGTSDQNGLIFKVQWMDTNQVAYMEFSMAKKKYPLIVLDYLASRIKQKPINQPPSHQVANEEKKILLNSPMTQHSSNIMIQGEDKKDFDTPVEQFFRDCSFCKSQKICTKMLDYDAIIPIDSNIAYPVHLKLQSFKSQRERKKPFGGVSPMKIREKQYLMSK